MLSLSFSFCLCLYFPRSLRSRRLVFPSVPCPPPLYPCLPLLQWKEEKTFHSCEVSFLYCVTLFSFPVASFLSSDQGSTTSASTTVARPISSLSSSVLLSDPLFRSHKSLHKSLYSCAHYSICQTDFRALCTSLCLLLSSLHSLHARWLSQ